MALKLYMNAIRVVLNVDIANEDSWSRIYGSVCCLRQSLLCTGCQNLLIIPQRPESNRCEHSYCRRCIYAPKPPCKWCKGNPKFENHVRMRVILQCYKKMCRYIMSSGIFSCWDKSRLTSPMVRFISMVYEGAGLGDRYHHVSKSVGGPLTKKPKTTKAANAESTSSQPPKPKNQFIPIEEGDNNANIKLPRVLIKKAGAADRLLTVYPIPDASSEDSEIDCPKVVADCLTSVKKKSCHCGMTSHNPGNRRCCGQRCPCYVKGRACINCRCKGCRNPQKNLICSPPQSIDHYHKTPKKAYAVKDQDIFFDEESYSDSETDISDFEI